MGGLCARVTGKALGEGSLISLLSQLFPEIVTGQVLQELKQIAAGGEGKSRPWRARAKSDLQLGATHHPGTLPAICPGALALSGVLRRLQQVEEKIVQVNALLCLCRVPSHPPPSSRPGLGGGGACLPPSVHSCLPSCTFLTPAFSWLGPSASVTLCFSLPLSWTAEEGSELGQQGIPHKEH